MEKNCKVCEVELTDEDYKSGNMIFIDSPEFDNKLGKTVMKREYLCNSCENSGNQQEHERMYPSLYGY